MRNRLFTTIAKGIFETVKLCSTKVVRVEVEKNGSAMLPSPYTPSNMRFMNILKGTEPTEVSSF